MREGDGTVVLVPDLAVLGVVERGLSKRVFRRYTVAFIRASPIEKAKIFHPLDPYATTQAGSAAHPNPLSLSLGEISPQGRFLLAKEKKRVRQASDQGFSRQDAKSGCTW